MSEQIMKGLLSLILLICWIWVFQEMYKMLYPSKPKLEPPKKSLSDYFTVEENAQIRKFTDKVILNGMKEVKEEKEDG
jgi:hypothetical protein